MGDGQPSDREVIQRCRRGQVEPFSTLVRRYQDRVYNLAFRLMGNADDALDAAQETMVRAYTALPQFDLDRPFAPWLFRIATNSCYGILRKRRPDISFEEIGEQETDAALVPARGAEGDPQQLALRAWRADAIQRAVLALPEPFRTVILLRYMEDMSYEEIAVALDIPLGTVKTYLHRGRQRLRAALSDD